MMFGIDKGLKFEGLSIMKPKSIMVFLKKIKEQLSAWHRKYLIALWLASHC